jgi:hypothetical protein
MGKDDSLQRFWAHQKVCERFDFVLPRDLIAARVALCEEIVAIPSATIRARRTRA